MQRLRAVCLALPHALEAASYGNPAFKVAKKAFVVVDHYQGGACVWTLCPAERRDEVLAQPGWFASPYDPRKKAVCARPDEADWAALESLIRESYALAAAGG
jgi:predicted DNA-binding protein (MmcQ/YjbR family)